MFARLLILMISFTTIPAAAKLQWKTFDCISSQGDDFGFAQVQRPSGQVNSYVALTDRKWEFKVDAHVQPLSETEIVVVAGTEDGVVAEGICLRKTR